MDAARRRVPNAAQLAWCVALLLTASACIATAAPIPTAWTPLPPGIWQQGARPDSGGRDAIIVLDEAEYLDRRDGYRQHRHRIVRILTENGRDAGRIEFDESKGGTKVLGLRARSVREDGAITELAPDQILTSTVRKSGGEEITRTSFTVPGIEPGCIIEYSYSVEGKLGGPPFQGWSFQNEHYTVESRLRWKLIQDFDYEPRWTTRRIGLDHVGQRCVPDCIKPREMSFVVYAIPGNEDESWGPPQATSGPRLAAYYMLRTDEPIDYWTRWKFGLDGNAEHFGEDIGELEAVIARAKSSSADPEQQLNEVFRWIRDRVHSTAEPSWEARQTDDEAPSYWGRNKSIEHLILRGQGAPYELNMAFSHAARALGFESFVILVRDRRDGPFEYDIVGRFPTNPVTAVRRRSTDRWRFYQPASRFSVPANVPWFERGGKGLTTGKGAELTLHVRTEDGLPGRSHWNVALGLDGDGNLSGRVSAEIEGEMARSYRAKLWEENPSLRATTLSDDLSPDDRPVLELQNPNLSTPPESAFTIAGTAKYTGAATKAGELMTLEVAGLIPWRLEGDFTPEQRSEPVFMRFPRTESVSVEIELGRVAVVDELPRSLTFENEVGSWRSQWKRTANGVRLERTVDLLRGEYSPATYRAVREFFTGLSQADRELLVVRRP